MFDVGIMAVLALGFVLGMKHALDADHVVAVSAIAGNSRSIVGASIVGAFWGIGHTITLFLVGVLMLALKISIPPRVALLLEMGVGLMLVFLGGVVAAGLIKERLDFHPHEHNGNSHIHHQEHQCGTAGQAMHHADSHGPVSSPDCVLVLMRFQMGMFMKMDV